jgi:phage protein D
MAATNGDTPRVRVARPSIHIDGKENSALALGLMSLLIAENTNGLYRCEAIFGNWGDKNGKTDFLYFDRSTLDFGKAFVVKLGTAILFEGRIMAIEGRFSDGRPPEITILAEDRLQDLRMTRRTRTFHDLSDADLFRQIANEHGLTPTIDLSGPTHKVLAQINQSDLAFLRERARALDAEVWMEGSTLNAKARARRNSGTLRMNYGDQLREFSVLADLARQHTSISVNGWDVSGKAALTHEATDALLNGELNGDLSGASILASAIGQRKEALAHTVPLTSQETQAEAEAYFRMHARRFVTGRGLAETDARLRVGSYVELQGLGSLFSGKYYLCEVQVSFEPGGGLRTEFTAERPGLGKV